MPTDAATALLVALRAHVQALHEAVDRVTGHAAGEPGAAADLRDAASRMSALLGSSGAVLEAAHTDPVRADLVRLARIAGGVRDADVISEIVAELTADVPRALVVGPVADRVRRQQQDRRAQASEALAKAVRDEWCVSALAAADRLVISPPLAANASGKAAKVLARAARDDDARLTATLDELRAATGAGERERLWPAVRDASLALAGSARIAREEHGKKARKLAEAADEVAARIDELSDTVRVRRLLVDLADLAHRHREPGFTYGLLHAAAARRGDAARTGAESALRDLTSSKLRTWLPGS